MAKAETQEDMAGERKPGGARVWLFRGGVATAVGSLVANLVSRLYRFPMVPNGEGHFVVSPLLRFWFAAAGWGALLTIALSLFGRGMPRWLLLAAGLLLLVLAYRLELLTFA
jgi:hypothetical protein